MMKRIVKSLLMSVAAAALVALAAAGCGSSTGAAPQSPAPTAHGAFVGYKWTVVAIAHDGKTTAIPPDYSVFLIFTPDGQFVANEPVNTHGGTFRVTGDGFVTSDVGMTLVGYVGDNPIILLAESAIGSFNSSAHATASVAGNRLTVVVGGYTLTSQRDGKQANFPQPSLTGSS
jgi:hypothetical protein